MKRRKHSTSFWACPWVGGLDRSSQGLRLRSSLTKTMVSTNSLENYSSFQADQRQVQPWQTNESVRELQHACLFYGCCYCVIQFPSWLDQLVFLDLIFLKGESQHLRVFFSSVQFSFTMPFTIRWLNFSNLMRKNRSNCNQFISCLFCLAFKSSYFATLISVFELV